MADPVATGALRGLASPLFFAADGSPSYAADSELVKQYVRNVVMQGGDGWFGTWLDWEGLETLLFEYDPPTVILKAQTELPVVLSVLAAFIVFERVAGEILTDGSPQVNVYYRIRRTNEPVQESFGGAT